MSRKYTEELHALLDKWESKETIDFVESKGVARRNWRMLCLEAGMVDGRPWKQCEIARTFRLSVARVSAILKTVRARLSEPDEGRTALGMTRKYRAGRYRFLKDHPIVNASSVMKVVLMFRDPSRTKGAGGLGWDGSIEFVAGGKRWRVMSVGRRQRKIYWDADHHPMCSGGYIVFWMEEDSQGLGNNVGKLFLGGGANCTRPYQLVLDCGGVFWVVDSFNVTAGNRLVVRLKPAEHAGSETMGRRQA